MALPDNVGSGTVVGRFIDQVGGDPLDDEVTFTPSVQRWINVTAAPPTTIIRESTTVTLVDGEIPPGTTLMATDDEQLNPVNWTYEVRFKKHQAQIPPFHIHVPEDTTVDLTVVSPVPSSTGTSITRGQGVQAGGETGQVLAKASAANYDTEWVDVDGVTPPNLGELPDVDVSSVSDGQTIVWESAVSKWVPGTGSAPVQSVNGKTGTVSLSASDVGARPDDYVPSWSQVTSKPSVFPPESHTHAVADVSGLQDDLDGKADISFNGTMRFRGYGSALPNSGNQEGDVFLLVGGA